MDLFLGDVVNSEYNYRAIACQPDDYPVYVLSVRISALQLAMVTFIIDLHYITQPLQSSQIEV